MNEERLIIMGMAQRAMSHYHKIQQILYKQMYSLVKDLGMFFIYSREGISRYTESKSEYRHHKSKRLKGDYSTSLDAKK